MLSGTSVWGLSWLIQECFYSPLDGMLVHHRVTPSIKFGGTLLYMWVVLPKNTRQPGWLDPETNALTSAPLTHPSIKLSTISLTLFPKPWIQVRVLIYWAWSLHYISPYWPWQRQREEMLIVLRKGVILGSWSYLGCEANFYSASCL